VPPGVRPPPRSPHLSGLKESVRQLLDLDDDTAVMIRQLACTEPGCPPVETVVAVLPMDAQARRWTLHRPVAQITSDDLRALLANPPEGA
jgi:hypothetical protein